MPALSRTEAAKKLVDAVEEMDADELIDFHHGLFPGETRFRRGSSVEPAVVRKKILAYMTLGPEVEEILDLWSVVFSEAWNVSYDEDTDEINYSLTPESVGQED